MHTHNPCNAPQDTGPFRYRIILCERLETGAEAWFGDVVIGHQGEKTVLDVVVSDQAALHGVLRRIHDLHLKLLSVRATDAQNHPINEGTSS